jgi:hypothetical protein
MKEHYGFPGVPLTNTGTASGSAPDENSETMAETAVTRR